ncbi:phosphopyruvate hydratase [Streptomyces sp. NPDC008343]|uniref:phosphopyruvate hydratase n=1 Tax=Streptomyces sp. NPDC008343 TaxID=3364828 RepID=UPI0036E52453
MSGILTDLRAWQALDSRGRPTVAVAVRTDDGAVGRVIVPSGASTGRHEARELRDGGASYDGMAVLSAVTNVREKIAPVVLGRPASDQAGIDAALEAVDGTSDLGVLGANAVLAVSLATLCAAADHSGRELFEYLDSSRDILLPRPMFNIVSGGAHAGRQLDIQDVLAIPLRAESFAEALEIGTRVRAGTACAFEARNLPTSLVADEGGLAGPLGSNCVALELVHEGIERAGLQPGRDVGIALDVAATQLYRDGRYWLTCDGRDLSAQAMVAEIAGWLRRYDVVSVEDPLAEDDWEGWELATKVLGGRSQLIGDDLFVTNVTRLQRGVSQGIGNAVLVKPNQIGTVSRTADLMVAARQAGYATVVSARSGDTEDTWLADLAVGWRAGQIKVGSTTRSERTAKWNRLLEIEELVGSRGRLAHI